MSDKIEIIDGKVFADYLLIKRLVKKSRLRSKKTRKVMKRFKILITNAIMNYVDNVKRIYEV